MSTQVFIEDKLKIVLNLITIEGKTISNYILAKSHAIGLNLVNPNDWLTSTTTIITVIYPSQRSTIAKTHGSDIFNWIGLLKVYSRDLTLLESYLTELKEEENTNPFLEIHQGGIDGDPILKKWFSICTYNWKKHVTH